jgi:adenylosuccinate lyase
MSKINFDTYQSPFSWRYGSDAMRRIWSEENKFKIMRRIWVDLAEVQTELGLLTQEELEDLKKNQNDIDIERILEIEKETRHDIVAAIREFSEKAKIGGGKIHLGATSMDIVDNTDTIRVKESLEIIEIKLKDILQSFATQIEVHADTVCMGYTHLQPAEPTTIGYRLALYAQDLLGDFAFLQFVTAHLKAKGFKGAVGTQASYTSLLDGLKVQLMEQKTMKKLGLEPVLIANQVGPRKTDLNVSQLLSSIAQSLNKFAFDLRVMQSAGIGEWQEPFSENQVGSSSMPFKRNPRKSEQICSLALFIQNLSANAWDNASLSLLERTLDDSANRRAYIPEIFLALEDILTSANNIIMGLTVHELQVKNNLNKFAPFSATEILLVEAVKKGADRQEIHEELRKISQVAWQDVAQVKQNPMKELLKKSEKIRQYLSPVEIEKYLDVKAHVGTAPQRARKLAEEIKKII